MQRPSLRFDDQVVLVTGASSGIGRETALAFAAAGACVVLVARRAEALAEVARTIRTSGGRAIAVAADVTDAAAVQRCFRRALTRFGRLDIVVNNAGVLIPSPVATLAPGDLQRMLDVNLFGALHVMQTAVRQMRRQASGGHIVNVGSLAGRRGYSPIGGYSATKFALVGLTEALRTELAGSKVHVSLVLPGVVDTPMAEKIDDDPTGSGIWPKAWNMPRAWVVWAIFAAVRLRLTEVSVPPGSALLEKLAALTPGTTDTLVRSLTNLVRRKGRR